MALNLMYITNDPAVAQIAEQAGVDWIFVDMEFIGKDDRQGGLDTVQNHHTIEDIRNIKNVVKKAKILVRVNPIHKVHNGYFDSKDEIDAAVEAGADILMLPFFHTVQEVTDFVGYVKDSSKKHGRKVQTCLGMKFMFQLLTDGIVEQLTRKILAKGIPFGFGGIASLHSGALPGSYVLKEHYRLGSSMVIVGRSFCNTKVITDLEEIRRIFNTGIAEIRKLEEEAQKAVDYFKNNHEHVVETVDKIVEDINSKRQ